MAEHIPLNDIKQYFQNSIILYKGVPTYVSRVIDHHQIQILNIRTGHTEIVKFVLEDFQNPAFRLGMVNVLGTVVWMSRIPVRRYSVGVNQQNIKIKFPDIVEQHGGNIHAASQRMGALCVPELADCIEGKYPDFNSAYEQAIALEGTIAFDKQFAIHYDGSLIYKTTTVGFVDPESSLTEASFTEQHRYLHLLLDKRYEKGIGNHRM